VGDLRNRTSQFQTTRILDRNGQPLYEILDPNAGGAPTSRWRIFPPILSLPPSPPKIRSFTVTRLRPHRHCPRLWQNYITDGEGGGASTITQQLARALLLSPEERAERTYSRKTREIILAAEITRRYSKDEILELYLNEIYYGNLAYGAEAAAETYFGKSVERPDVG
jgi:hypothetical protein